MQGSLQGRGDRTPSLHPLGKGKQWSHKGGQRLQRQRLGGAAFVGEGGDGLDDDTVGMLGGDGAGAVVGR